MKGAIAPPLIRTPLPLIPLVSRFYLEMPTVRLCLIKMQEAEPLDWHYQAEPGNEGNLNFP